VAGHLPAALGRIPEAGEEFDIDGTRVEIEAVEGGVITSVIFGHRAGAHAHERDVK
jgi:CBS domain containing-hemolysin-like protein